MKNFEKGDKVKWQTTRLGMSISKQGVVLGIIGGRAKVQFNKDSHPLIIPIYELSHCDKKDD